MPDNSELKQSYIKLINKIDYHNKLYYQKNSPEISDFEYDKLYKELVEFENNYPELISDLSPTRMVGSGTNIESAFGKVNHEVPLLSLSNTYDIQEIFRFLNRIFYSKTENKKKIKRFSEEKVEMVIEEKIDGISIELLYLDGELTRGATRGDGITGDDITHNILVVNDIPHFLNPPFPEKLIVRGEIYMSYENFEKLNKSQKDENKKLFMNPRNATGGALHLKDSVITKKRNLQCFVYDVLFSSNNSFQFHNNIILGLKNMGFSVSAYSKLIDIESVKHSEIKSLIDDYDEKRKELEYPVDGLVFKVNSIKQREILGTNVKDPKWGFAFKFRADRMETNLLSIEYNVGRTGAITPVAVLDEILLDGSKVSRASLHNFDYINKKNLKINDIVIVEKAAEIIPQIVEVKKHTKESKDILEPEFCPICNAKLSGGTENNSTEKILKCINPLCDARLEQSLIYFVKRDNMNIDSLGEKMISRLFKLNLIKYPSDIYKLKIEDILPLKKIGHKLAHNILTSIENSKKVTFTRFLRSLGIPGIGKSNSASLAKWLDKPDSIFTIFCSNEEDVINSLLEIDGFGKILASDIYEFFTNEKILNEIRELLKFITIIDDSSQNIIKSKIFGKIFCITGKLTVSRNEIAKIIEKMGGNTVNSISSKVDYLICGENGGSKLKKSNEMGIPIISEEEFRNMVPEDKNSQDKYEPLSLF